MAEGGDDHWVPRDTMEKLYLYDDRYAFVQHMQDRNIPVAVVNNEADGEEHLQELVEELRSRERLLSSALQKLLTHRPC